MEIRVITLREAYESAVYHTIWNHDIVITQDGADTWQIKEPLQIVVTDPANEDFISKLSPYGDQFYEKYAQDILEGTPHNAFEYTYHERLFKYYTYTADGVTYDNQIQYIISMLRENPSSRRAVAITWQPHTDPLIKDVPCLQEVQCWIMHDRLNAQFTFRSEDLLMALPANMYGLTNVMMFIASQLNVKLGIYYHFVTLGHIYYKNDATVLKRWC